jgi:tetratricopeptide (TPR) repeat protein
MSEAIKLAGLNNDQAVADRSEVIKLARGSNGSIEELRRYAGNQFYFWGRALAYRAKGDYDHAIADFDRARLLASNNDFSALLLSLRGEVYYMKGDNNRAIASYDASLSLKVTQIEPGALYGRGLAKLKNGDRTGGNADISAAKAIKADIADEAARHGVKP